MSSDQKLLVGSDGALYCRVSPAPAPPTMLYDLDTRRVEAGMAVRSSYLQDVTSGVPIGFGAAPGVALESMYASPYAHTGVPPGMMFQQVGAAVQSPLTAGNAGIVPEMAFSGVPLTSAASQAPRLSAPVQTGTTLEAEIAASRSRLREQEEITNSLLGQPSAKRLRRMPVQGGQSPAGQAGLSGVGTLTTLQATGQMPGMVSFSRVPVSGALSGAGAFAQGIFPGAQMGYLPLGTPAHARRVSNVSKVFPMYMKSDDMNISPFQCLARKQIEVFEANEEDAGTTAQGRNKPIVVGQVGIRCIHCVNLPRTQRKTGAVYYPNKLAGIYQTAQKMIMGHLMNHCSEIPEETREKLKFYKTQKSSDGGGKRYWGDGVKSLGVYETPNEGLAFKPDL